MYCKKCGAEIQKGQQFCPNCGMPVDASAASRTSANTDQQPEGQQYQYQANAQQQTQQQYQQTYQQTYQQPQYQQTQYQQSYQQPHIPGRNETIACMVLGIVSVVFIDLGLVSVIMAVIGLILAVDSKKKGYDDNMQAVGFILCLIGVIGGVVLFIACISCGINLASLAY